MRSVLSKNRTIGILFIEGFVSVSLQMIMMRQLVPFVGSSVIVSSLVVGFFLASLAIGYAVGGRTKDNHIKRLVNNLCISAVILSIGLSYPVMDFIFKILNSLVNNPLIEISLYLLFFLSPIVFLLGQTVPILTNFYKSKTISEVAGDSFAINTIGSVLGSVITSLLFFNLFGMSVTILIDVALIGLVIFLLLDKDLYLKYLLIYTGVFLGAYVLNVDYERSNFNLTNAYNNYEVEELEYARYFKMNKSYSSGLFKDDTNWAYIEDIKNVLFSPNQMAMKDSDILILGAGGFTLSSSFDVPKNNYVYVDIDPDIKEVAERDFLKKEINGTFIAEDARVFVKKSKTKYDAILVDLYSNKMSIPWHLVTNEFIQDVKGASKENGVVIFNIGSEGFFGDEYSKTVYNTIHNNFDYCLVKALNTKGLTNVIYYCKNTEEEKRKMYIDDKSKPPFEELQ